MTLSSYERNELESLRKFKRDTERQPIINRLVELTQMQPEHFEDFSDNDLKRALKVAENASTRRYGISTGDFSTDEDDYAEGFEFDETAGKWKQVKVRVGDRPKW